jgi:hypothetical protein
MGVRTFWSRLMIRAVLFVLAALFFGGGAAQAADHDLTEPVAGHPGVTGRC